MHPGDGSGITEDDMVFERFIKHFKKRSESTLGLDVNESNEEPVKIGFGPCCFCGGEIEATEVDPCSLAVETVANKWQMWFCHAECFKSRIVTDSYMDLSPAHF